MSMIDMLKKKLIKPDGMTCHGHNGSLYTTDCPICGAKVTGYVGYDAGTEKEFPVSKNWKPQHSDLSGPFPIFDKEPLPIVKYFSEEQKRRFEGHINFETFSALKKAVEAVGLELDYYPVFASACGQVVIQRFDWLQILVP